MFPTLSIGPFVLPTGPLLYILGGWLALSGVERAAKRINLDVPAQYGLASTALFAGIVSARLVFVTLHWSAYTNNLFSIIWPINSGFNIWGGVLGGIFAGILYARAKEMPAASSLDALIFGLIVGLIFISLADFAAGPGYGKSTTVFWGITQFGLRRHAVQIYELLIGLLALGVWWRLHSPRFNGQLALTTISIYSAGRLFTDAFRANAWLTSNGFHIIQIWSLLMLLFCLAILTKMSGQPQEAINP